MRTEKPEECHAKERANAKTLKQERAFYVKGKGKVPVWLEHGEQRGGWLVMKVKKWAGAVLPCVTWKT